MIFVIGEKEGLRAMRPLWDRCRPQTEFYSSNHPAKINVKQSGKFWLENHRCLRAQVQFPKTISKRFMMPVRVIFIDSPDQCLPVPIWIQSNLKEAHYCERWHQKRGNQIVVIWVNLLAQLISHGVTVFRSLSILFSKAEEAAAATANSWRK